MRISSRLLLLFIVITIVFGAFFYMFYHFKHEEMRLYNEADRDQRRHTINAVIQIKNETLIEHTENYAIWDETVTFARNLDPVWANSNLKTIISNLDYSLVQIYDKRGRLLYSDATQSAPGTSMYRLEPAIMDSLGGYLNLNYYTRFHEQLLSCSISSIHPSWDTERKYPSGAYILLAQSWNNQFLAELGKSLGYDIRLSYEEPKVSDEVKQYNTRILLSLQDFNRHNVAWLEFYSSNPFLMRLRNLGNLILFGTMGFIFIFLLMQFFLIQQWINSPLYLISKSLEENDPAHIKPLHEGNNEFSAVAHLIERFFAQKEELVSEIDERIKSETRLREMEEQTRKILQTSPESIIVTDLEGRILDLNNESLKLLKADSIEEFVKVSPLIEDLVRRKERRQMQGILRDLSKGSYVKNREIFIENDQGRGFPGLLSASVILDDNGKPVRFVFVTRDISEIRSLEQQLRQSQKMESIGTLAGGIAHDFNNIITIIAGYIALATGKINEPKKAEADMDAALKACLRAKSLIGKILTFSRQSEPDMEDLMLAAVIEESLPMIRALLPSKIQIETNINSFSFTTADFTELQQILINLSTNAYHAMRPDGGTLSIDLDELPGQELVGLDPNLNSKSRYLHLHVSDTGCGIAPDILSRIFDPYFSTKSSGEGTGLGLSIVHGIVTGYKGFVTVRSVISEGTNINIYLPVNENPQKKIKPENKDDAPFIQAKLMIIDDEQALVDIFCEAMRDAGYTVEAFTDSPKALEAFKKDPTAWNLIIADINMPKMDGIRLVEKIRAIRMIPVLLYTGFLDINLQTRVEEAGLKNVMHKPILPDTMIRKVRKIIYEESEYTD